MRPARAALVSTRPSDASTPPEAPRPALADDVAAYLTRTPRQLPSRLLYDELGSSLFEAICRLPWYRITRIEQRLLRTHADEIFGRLRPVSTVVELGPGSGEKLATLMASRRAPDVTVHLVDVSSAALEKATDALAARSSLTAVAHQATYEAGLAAIGHRGGTSGQTLVVFLGSNIGNFDPPETAAFLRGVRTSLGEGDALLLGTDLVKPEPELLLAYDDPLGVTAAFNRNLLVRINRELGGDFDVSAFAHRAVWNAAASRVEMHLVSGSRQRVRVLAAGIDITFEAGESIWTESSYKYRAEDLAPMLARAGFLAVGRWAADGFALTLAEAG
jgi:L-histidine Nalpha-methyltransferase